MRKTAVSILLAAVLLMTVLLFTGCQFAETIQAVRIEKLKDWSFQYNESTDDFSLFFALCDSTEQNLSACVDVDIRIMNDNGEEIYNGTKSITEEDFGVYSSKYVEAQLFANVKIPASEVKEGTSSNGTVYFTVHKEGLISFDEADCQALYCLPIGDVRILTDALPVELSVKDYHGDVSSKIRIEDVSTVYDKGSGIMPLLTVTVSGTKTFETDGYSSYDIVSYKLYDSEGYMVDSGNVYLSSLSEGDRFRDDSIVFYDLTPCQSYTLKFFDYDR